MSNPFDPNLVHIPSPLGEPICGSFGRTSTLEPPTCSDCRERTTLGGIEPEDVLNPGHPIGRIVMGSAFGVPGFPKIPGVWKRFRGDDK